MSGYTPKTYAEIEYRYIQIGKNARDTSRDQRKALLDREIPALRTDIHHSADLGLANRKILADNVEKHLYKLLEESPPESPLFQELIQHASVDTGKSIKPPTPLKQYTSDSQHHDM